MARLVLVTLLTTAALCGAAQPPSPPPPPPPGRYKDFYHSYTLRQQVESQESFSGRGAGPGGLPTGPSAPSAPAASEAPPPAATPAPPTAPDQKPTAEALTAVQVADAHERASSPVYYHAYPYYTYGGWPVMAHAVVAPAAVVPHPAWGRQSEPSARAAGVIVGHHGGFFHHPGLFGAHHGGAIVGHHGLVSHHGGTLKGLHGLATHHDGLVKSHHGLATHHSGLVKGHHGLVGHHGGLVKTPLGLISKHGGSVLLHARDATGSQPAPAEGQPMAQQQQLVPLYAARSALPQQYGGYHVLQPHYLGWKSLGHDKKGGGAAPVPAMPGKIKGGADVALFNAHGHGSHKGLQGATAHKYKHFNLDVGFGCPPAARPLHLMHTDAGYDVSHYTVGGAASAGANVAHGLGGTFGLL